MRRYSVELVRCVRSTISVDGIRAYGMHVGVGSHIVDIRINLQVALLGTVGCGKLTGCDLQATTTNASRISNRGWENGEEESDGGSDGDLNIFFR